MNSVPNSNVFKYIYKIPPNFSGNMRGDLNKNKYFMEQFYRENLVKLNIRSAYDSYKGLKNENVENHPDFTTYTHEFIGNLDYIIYNDNNLAVSQLLRVPCNDEVIKKEKLPNFKYPSDHLKIAARFKFTN